MTESSIHGGLKSSSYGQSGCKLARDRGNSINPSSFKRLSRIVIFTRTGETTTAGELPPLFLEQFEGN